MENELKQKLQDDYNSNVLYFQANIAYAKVNNGKSIPNNVLKPWSDIRDKLEGVFDKEDNRTDEEIEEFVLSLFKRD